MHQARIAVIIPSFRVTAHVMEVLAGIGPGIDRIFVVDDACPDGSGDFVARECSDQRVAVVRHASNRGVGGAVITGYQAAMDAGCTVLVKMDGDGQMDPALLEDLVAPILAGRADYTKGNRFFDLDDLESMPKLRLFGNAALSFMAKLSTGYWNLFDPTNGYTAIHADVARALPWQKISRRYFFETDLLFRLGIARAAVVDVPMPARYGSERSNLRIARVLPEFLGKHVRNFFKRIFYTYYLRDLSLASVQLPLGLALTVFGVVEGSVAWNHSLATGIVATAGTVMLAALPIIVGTQLLLSFLAYDIANVPRSPRHRPHVPGIGQ
jgi:glycosyltransferase involved in cell wall biosynthesis